MVAMSGGVDSSVAASLCLDAGFEVTGVTLRLWGGGSDSGCCSVGDVEDARRVASQLGIPHYVFNFAEEFEDTVVSPYVAAYARGRTPNPCVECNRSFKFGRLLERALILGFDAIATGHHARVATATGLSLLRGRDEAKDQSYVLYMLGQAELAHLVLPVGELTKDQVRSRARALGLRTADKPESMDVCFIERHGRRRFLEDRGALRPGEMTDTGGRVLGSHPGVATFTIGQRRGLGVSSASPRYVVDIDASNDRLVVGGLEELGRDRLEVDGLSFVGDPPGPEETLLVQVRAHGEPTPGLLAGDTVRLSSSQPRVAPGQVVAFYRGAELVGGGTAR